MQWNAGLPLCLKVLLPDSAGGLAEIFFGLAKQVHSIAKLSLSSVYCE